MRGIARPGDVVAVSETALAIAQGEFVPAEYVRPSKLAYALARRAGPMATVSQPESMQLVIDRAGHWSVVTRRSPHVRRPSRSGAAVPSTKYWAMPLRRSTAIPGTMPPFERAIVFAPRDPAAFAQRVSERVGVGCAVVDANDLEKAKVLGSSRGVSDARVERALLDNPHGNGDEQTPIVVLKWRGNGIESAAAATQS